MYIDEPFCFSFQKCENFKENSGMFLILLLCQLVITIYSVNELSVWAYVAGLVKET